MAVVPNGASANPEIAGDMRVRISHEDQANDVGLAFGQVPAVAKGLQTILQGELQGAGAAVLDGQDLARGRKGRKSAASPSQWATKSSSRATSPSLFPKTLLRSL